MAAEVGWVWASFRLFEWNETVTSSNEDEGVLMLRVFTVTTAVDDFTTKFENKVTVFPFNLEHLMSQQTLESMFSCLLLSSRVFLKDSSAHAMSQSMSSALVRDYHFTRHMPNTRRKSKIVIVVDVFIGEEDEDFYMEMLGDDHSDILKELEKFCLNSKPITTTHEPKVVLKHINIGVKISKLTDDDDRPEEEYECPICLKGFLTGTVAATLRCSHVFHADCMNKWLSESNSCPLCRSLCATVVYI
ncbi:E3 ubiquitin-protein ligase BIG BROTHER-like [Cornus florida]|uniref:E3 ubiquitin-protein ligase BIG BROTHER-like n=1 Tax=Cornus florida TaxID=4283 RepID=UPI00289E00E2|nr:E3 ubiquitin-protein ligase BIG BROTHER-like [Cornus florida]